MDKFNANNQKGFTLAELLVALALFSIFAGGATLLIVGAYSSTRQGELLSQAALTEQEAFEALNSIGNAAFNELQSGDYTLTDETDEWELSEDPVDPSDDYRTSVTIEDVYRDGSWDIAETGTFDPHTRKLTSTVEWDVTEARPQSVESHSYITDWGSSSIFETTEAEFLAGTSSNVLVTNDDDGEIRIDQATMEAGLVQNVEESWTTVTLEHEYDNPVVATVYHEEDTDNLSKSISTRVRNVTSTSFQVRLQEASDTDPDLDVDPDDVYYLVVEEGAWSFGDDDTIIEAGLHETNTTSSSLGGYTGDTVSFDSSFSSDPVVFHQVMTYDDSSWISSNVSAIAARTTPPTSSGMWISMLGAQVTATHGTETLGWIAIEGNVQSSVDGVSFETFITPDEVQGHSNGEWTYTYQHGSLSSPRALATQLAMDGGDGSWAVLTDIDSTSVSMHAEEDQILDAERWHTTENFGYFAVSGDFSTYVVDQGYSQPTMEVGSVTTDSGVGVTLEAGTVASVDGSAWSSVSFTNTDFTDPVVTAIQLENNNTGPVSVRIRNVSNTGFEATLQAPDGSTPSAETVSYLAVERGAWYIDGHHIEADSATVSTVGASSVIGGTWSADSQSYLHSYSSAPIVLHQVQTANDEDWISSWVSRQGTRSQPPNTSGFQVAMNGAQATTTHDPETIGWIVIDRNISGSIGGVDFETQQTTDSIGGHDNGCYTQYYSAVNSSSAFTIDAQQEIDGGDGSWAVLCDQDSNRMGIHDEEDQEYDSERWHTTETHGFIAFSDSVSTTYDPGWTTVDLQQSYTSPVIVITGHESANTDPVSARIQNITSTSFQTTLQTPDGATGIQDDIHYMVVEEGQWKINDTRIEAYSESISTVASSTALGGSWIGDSKSYSHNYSSNPIVFHQVMSLSDEDWITTWVSRQGARNHPPNTSGFQIALNGAQVTTTHDPETIGWIVIEDVGTDEIDGVELRTDIPSTEMQGHDNGCTSETHGGTYSDPVVLGSQLEMDGADGSWIMNCEITGTTVGFHAEEDQELDSERAHTTEIYGYAVFEEAMDMQGDEASVGTYESIIFGPYTNYHILEWTEDENGCAGCDIHVQLRTSDTYDDLYNDIEAWAGEEGEGTYYEETSGHLIHTDHVDHDYLQYRVLFEGDEGETSIFEDITLYYTP